MDSAHLRPLRSRWPDPEHVSRRREEGLYHTADASLWFFHALARYLDATDDRVTLRHILPKLHDIVERHLRGTRFGIRVDPSDGLLAQGADGYQLTWMDAKVDDWVVTPRRGKAVEINALWYNALCLLVRLGASSEDDAAAAANYADLCRARPRILQPTLLESGDRLSLRRHRRRVQRRIPAMIRLAAPINSSPFRSRIRVLDEARWNAVVDAGHAAPAHAGRFAIARARRPGLQAEICRRPARPRCRLSSGLRLGVVDRSVHRCAGSKSIPRAMQASKLLARLYRRIWTRRVSAPSVKSSMPKNRIPPAPASPRPGASPKFFAAGQSSHRSPNPRLPPCRARRRMR